ncbi:MAG: UMP kinase [bacterium]
MKTILLKLSGEVLAYDGKSINTKLIHSIAQQIKTLQKEIRFGIVIGGGNFFRGGRQGNHYGISRTSADTVGMLATIMNGVILQDLFLSEGLASRVLSALPVPTIVSSISDANIQETQTHNTCIIFAGGTGNPFFTTDTNAVIRALQLNADCLWKATNVDFVYTTDPKTDSSSKPLKKLHYNDVLQQKLQIIDSTAITLAQQHKLPVRIFNIFGQDSLLKAAGASDFGSIITN